MMNLTFLLISVSLAFFATWFITPKWIRKATTFGLVGKDMNKIDHPPVAEMGGLCVTWGFGLGILIYVGLDTFLTKTNQDQIYLFLAAYCTILMVAILGMLDDLLGWKKGITNWKKPLIVLPACIPMVVINAGKSTMELPFIGVLDWGILYPLLVIPIAITCAANGFNILAGYNGLEAGMGTIILLAMAAIAWVNQATVPFVLSLCMAATLLAFLSYNWYPARIFPGDTMTYAVGTLIACVAIFGQMQKAAVILFIPYIIDLILVGRSRFKAEAFARVGPDGRLQRSNTRYYKLTDLVLEVWNRIGWGATEKRVVGTVLMLEVILAVLALYSSLQVW